MRTPGIYIVALRATGRRTAWKDLRPPDPAGVLQVGPAVIWADGKAYVYSYRRILYELSPAKGSCVDAGPILGNL
jgi:hypothetical protein